jgi:hypothetical protein
MPFKLNFKKANGSICTTVDPLSMPLNSTIRQNIGTCPMPTQYIIYVRMNAQERFILKQTCIHVHFFVNICRDKAALSRVKYGLSFIKTVCTKNIALPCPVRLLPYTISPCQFMVTSLCIQKRYCHTFPKNLTFKYTHTIQ